MPSTFCKYREISRKTPKIDPAAASMRKRPPPTARSARRSIRKSGASVRSSKAAKPARPASVGLHDLENGDRKCGCDWEVDVEDHPPVGEFGEDAADQDADRSTC